MIRVLVVDDHPALRAGLEALLRAEPGFTCVGVASCGRELMRTVRRERVDVVLLDRRLEAEDGLVLCATLRTEAQAPPVVVYTADVDPDLAERARAAGAAAVVEKRADVGGLLDAIRLAARAGNAAVA